MDVNNVYMVIIVNENNDINGQNELNVLYNMLTDYEKSV